ncbi:MAG: type IV secretion system protein [Candidatus Omnitrophica bacterium]|nr:type IV secretion system protein [Candidatus Omnitrophota bacterium]MBU1134824.1 type IV secretion system protein [Candidatus Omnitrophota bacterium]MBU1810563.1 type IV secretion system protein [Candidatus Omnitrophota bacterium]
MKKIFDKCSIFGKKVLARLSIVKELLSFLWENKLWWMIPIVIVFILLGALIWLTQSSAVVPFIYTLF